MTFPDLSDMPKLTVPELLADFDAYLDNVVAGAFYLIVEEGRSSCVLMPYTEKFAVYTEPKAE
jgi:hypothetical protein